MGRQEGIRTIVRPGRRTPLLSSTDAAERDREGQGPDEARRSRRGPELIGFLFGLPSSPHGMLEAYDVRQSVCS